MWVLKVELNFSVTAERAQSATTSGISEIDIPKMPYLLGTIAKDNS